ncbi:MULTISPECIES: YceK/YidQ family lipoprotein [unclassified Pseudomonas]|uniref:YceK/YidQ family lipoprotein n=1 Tax=unclassified Pseudomonas TaxID=196821 RepID=UPI000A1DE0A4|nr:MULTISPECIES: YceK/YidQ family lipoprotein [unclassified Pseudomonas]
MKILAMALAALTLTGCGTVQTVARSDQTSVDYLKDKKTYCGAVPRIYSGVAFDFCQLNAQLGDGVDAFNHSNAPLGVVIDAAASGVLDTLLLPYTVYRQHTDGSIVIN